MQPVFGDRQVQHKTEIFSILGRNVLGHAIDPVLEPDLSVLPPCIVLEQNERRLFHVGEMRAQCGQQPGKLLSLVEPQTHPGTLLMLEALVEPVDEGVEYHHTTLAMRSTPAFWSGSMFTFTPSSRSGSQPPGRSSFDFQGVRIR